MILSSKFKNEICNSDKIIFDQLEIEPIEIQKDTIAIDNEITPLNEHTSVPLKRDDY